MATTTTTPDRLSAGGEELADFYEAFYKFEEHSPERPFEIDAAALMREIPINLTRFADWAREQDWATARSTEEIGSYTG